MDKYKTILILILIFFNVNIWLNYKHYKDTSKYNLQLQRDSIILKYNKKLNSYISEKNVYLVDNIKDLKNYDTELYNDFNKIKHIINGLNSRVDILVENLDSEETSIIKQDSNKYKIPWQFTYNDKGMSQSINGFTQFTSKQDSIYNINSKLINNKITVSLKYGLTKDNKVIAYSKSDRIQFKELNSFKIEKPKRFNFGLTVLTGLNSDYKGGNVRFGYGIGVGVTYNLKR